MTHLDVAALRSRAAALFRSGPIEEAIRAYTQLLTREPALPDSWFNLALLQYRARDCLSAIASCREALARRISNPEEVHLQLGVIFSDGLGESHSAREALAAALAINPNYVPAWLNLGNLHEDFGERQEAERAYRRALALDPANGLALARLAGVMPRADPGDPVITRIEAALARTDLSLLDRADLGFALGRLLDLSEAYDRAFAAYEAANAASATQARAQGTLYDRAAHAALVDRIIAAFPEPTPGIPDEQNPIFVCGMFRSGSTLAERILAAHSKISAAGELLSFPTLIRATLPDYPAAVQRMSDTELAILRSRYLAETDNRRPQGKRLVDKQLLNYRHVGLIRRVFPGARFVFMQRNALDNCLSVYFMHADPSLAYAARLIDIAHHFRTAERLMDHWRTLYPDDILTLDYDQLALAPEPEVRRLLAFCGLDWEDDMLSFDQHRAIRSASTWQVREPIHARSSGRWRHYDAHLGALHAALARG